MNPEIQKFKSSADFSLNTPEKVALHLKGLEMRQNELLAEISAMENWDNKKAA
jgi:hypothetical protein